MKVFLYLIGSLLVVIGTVQFFKSVNIWVFKVYCSLMILFGLSLLKLAKS